MHNGKNESDYDVIVMGGGPAGSCVSTLLAREGKRVLQLEREVFPRHHIGESLIPETYWPLKRMGVLEKVKNAGFTKKFSVQFANVGGKLSKPFYFFETNHHESAVTFQVSRDKFDKLILDHAKESGADVREGTTVKEVLFEGDRAVGVEAAPTAGGPSQRFTARVIVDATGLSAILGKRFGVRLRDPELRKGVVYGYFNNALRETGADAGATLVLRTVEGNGWFWLIPLADDVTSVGVVADAEYLFKDRGKDYEKILMEEIARCGAIRDRLTQAKRVDKVYTVSDYSFRSSRCAGPGWVLAGDAYGFLDPIYSTGVFLAFKSGELAADAILRAFETNNFDEATLGAHGPKLRQGIETFRKLVYAFYSEGFSFSKFLRKNGDLRGHIIDVLVGNVFRPGIDDLYIPMREFARIPEPMEFTQENGAGTNPAKREAVKA